MIPKLAHVVWVGGQPMPDRFKQMHEANKSILSRDGYELQLWDDSLCSALIQKEPSIWRFLELAYAQRQYAFVSDCIKMLVLDRLGGWVLDADNEVVGSLEPYATHGWVSGFEHWGGAYHPITAAMGAEPGHKFSAELLSAYKTSTPEALLRLPNTQWISDILWSFGMNTENKQQYLEWLDVTIYPSEIFCGPVRTSDTVILHHFAGSWLPTTPGA